MLKKRYITVYFILLIVFILTLLPAEAHPGHDDKPSPTIPPTITSTATVTPTSTLTLTPTATHTATFTPTRTVTPTTTNTLTPTPADTATTAPVLIDTVEPSPQSSATLEVEMTDEVTPEVTAEVIEQIITTPVSTATPIIEIWNNQPTATPALPANLSWVYLVGDTFEGADEEQPYQMDANWHTTTVTRGNAVQPSDTTTLRYSEFELFDLALLSDIYLVQGNVNFLVRQSRAGAYRLQVSADGTIALYWNRTELSVTQLPDPLSNGWHNIRLMVVDYSLQLYVDETLVLSYLDSNHVPAGTTSIYADTGAAVRLDNVEIWIPENLERSQPILEAVEAANPRATNAPRNSSADPTPEGSGALPAENSFWTNAVGYMQGGKNEFRYFRSPTCNHSITAGDVSGLISAINSANSDGQATVICLAAGTYTLTTSYVIQDGDNALPLITGEMHLYGDGAGAIIQRDALTPAPEFRFFRIEETGDLTLENLTLQYGVTISSNNGGYGGAIYNEGALTLVDSTLHQNGAENEGGALYNHPGATIDITDSTFTENGVYYDDGGAIDNNGDVTITGSTFQLNQTLNSDNDQEADGGAIRNEAGSTLIISNSSFIDNTAATYGGAVMNFGVLEISGSTFQQNTAYIAGGAIYLTDDPAAVMLDDITNTTFDDNEAITGDGGAVFTLIPVNFDNVDFFDNNAGGRGGAIYSDDVNVDINNAEFNTNVAVTDGGAIFSTRNGNSFDISYTLFDSNTGRDGGALLLQEGTHTITNSVFDNNMATRDGGAIYTDSNSLTINQDTIFKNNDAGSDGGAIFAYDTINVSDSIFQNNTAVSQGGAYRGWVSASSSITNSCIFGNQAANTSGVYSASDNFNATNNWWGTSDGPDGSGSGTGDEVNWVVNFSPFVTDVTCPLMSQSPTITVTGASATYTENDVAVSVITSVSITDSDSSNMSSASITISNLQDSNNEFLSVDTSGTTIVATYDLSGILTLTGDASVADYQQVLQTLTYENTSPDPDETIRLINILVNDGQADSNTEQISVSVVSVNAAPVMTLTGADAIYIEDGSPVTVLTSVSITDSDSTNLNGATITLSNAVDIDENLAVDIHPDISANYNSTTHILTLTGTQSLAEYMTLIQTLTYENTSSTPDTSSRDIEIVITDDNGSDSLSQVVRVYLDDVAETPDVDLDTEDASANYSFTYTEGNSTLAVGVVSITDNDSTHLTGLTIEFDSYGDTDSLTVDVTGTSLTTLYHQGKLTISGYATLVDYETVLGTLQYENTADDLDTSSRQLTVIASDGETFSTARTIDITITGINTAPSITLDADNIRRLAPDTAAIFIVDEQAINVTHTVVITDPEGDLLTGASIELSDTVDGTDEVIALDPDAFTGTNISINSSDNDSIELVGEDSLANYAALIQTLTYTNNALTPTVAGEREITITVTDNNATPLESESVTATITLDDIFPDDVTCFTWNSNTPDGWTSSTGGVTWSSDGMSSDGTVTPVQTSYQFPDNTPREITIDSNDANTFTVFSGASLAELSPLAPRADGTYYLSDEIIALEWSPPDTLIFESICYSSIEFVDLTVTHLETTTLDVDLETLDVSGTLSANISNTGTENVTDSFNILFFDDRNDNQQYDAGIDVILGQVKQDGIEAGQTLTVSTIANGTVEFAGDLVYVYVDSTDQIAESSEDNNLFYAQCEIEE